MCISLEKLQSSASLGSIMTLLRKVAEGGKLAFIDLPETLWSDYGEEAAVVNRATTETKVADRRCYWYNDEEKYAAAEYRDEWVSALEFVDICTPLMRNIHQEGECIVNDNGAAELSFDVEKVNAFLSQVYAINKKQKDFERMLRSTDYY